MSEIRVIAISMANKAAPLAIMATATSNALHILSVEQLPKSVALLTERLDSLEAKAKSVGAELVIEDPTGLFSNYGRHCRLDDKDSGNRPLLVSAMERYTSLTAVNAITYPSESKSNLVIQKSCYNVKQSDRGQVMYEIDWDSILDSQRVFLLCIHAAMCRNVFQEGFLEQILGHKTEPLSAGGHSAENVNVKMRNKGYGGRTISL